MADKLDIDEKLLRKLAAILSETGLTEIEYESGDQRIRVARGAALIAHALPGHSHAPAPVPVPDGRAPEAPGTVKSPMVGTVFVAPEPGKPPFVKVGDKVREGQTLLIIEAMKVMNSLPSPLAGTVTEILVGDGQPVEYGEPLLVIE